MKKLLGFIFLTPLLVLRLHADPQPRKEIEITTVRGTRGASKALEHTTAQLRAGYIFSNPGSTHDAPDTRAVALGGHLHMDTRRFYGLAAGMEGYGVLNLLPQEEPERLNPDFFDADKRSFALLSQAFVDGRWSRTDIKIGRQMIDTPHADSDDIRMMPNYFLAYMLTCEEVDHLTLTAGQLQQMAGWENGIDAKTFVSVEKAMGARDKTDGIYLVSALYQFQNLTLQGWYYDFDDIADVFYLEAGYETKSRNATWRVGIQYDRALARGRALLGSVESQTWGVSLEADFNNGITLLGALNRDNGKTGAFGSLGGGPFFTSLEEQTLDSVGEAGEAWIAGAGYRFGRLGIPQLKAAVIHGTFSAKNRQRYDTDETDIMADFSLGKELNAALTYAVINDKTDANEDERLFRLILNYNFKAL